MAVNFGSSSTVNVSKRLTTEKTPQKFCSFNGFMIQLFVVQSKYLYQLLCSRILTRVEADYWVLAIAICTFLILANYKRQSSWIQEHRIILWLLPWFFSALWAALGLAIVGYGDIGACMQSIGNNILMLLTKDLRVLVHQRQSPPSRQLPPKMANHRNLTRPIRSPLPSNSQSSHTLPDFRAGTIKKL